VQPKTVCDASELFWMTEEEVYDTCSMMMMMGVCLVWYTSTTISIMLLWLAGGFVIVDS
jgi:hypothetical protein